MNFLEFIELSKEEVQVIMKEKTPEELGWESHPGRGTWTWFSPDGNIAYRDEESYLLVGDNYVLISDAVEQEDGIAGLSSYIRQIVSMDVVTCYDQEAEA